MQKFKTEVDGEPQKSPDLRSIAIIFVNIKPETETDMGKESIFKR